MKLSRRAKRMQRHHARGKDRNATLNMVSLMDIFTILVFFLLVNATSAEVLPTPKNLTLPSSVAEKLPKKNLVIAVNQRIISLQGKPIVTVKDAMKGNKKTIQPLYSALRKMALQDKTLEDNKGVTIMGDRDIPYQLLKKIMLTCSGAKFSNLSFAVNQKQSVAEG